MIDSVLRRTSQIHIHVIRNFEAGFLISASMDGPGNIYIASSGTRYAYIVLKLSPPAHDYCQTLLRVPHIECDSSVATLFYDETNERLAVICVDKVDFIGINNRNILTWTLIQCSWKKLKQSTLFSVQFNIFKRIQLNIPIKIMVQNAYKVNVKTCMLHWLLNVHFRYVNYINTNSLWLAEYTNTSLTHIMLKCCCCCCWYYNIITVFYNKTLYLRLANTV